MDIQPVRAKSERGSIDILPFPSGALAVWMTVGSLKLHVVGFIPLTTLENWFTWLNLAPESWRKA